MKFHSKQILRTTILGLALFVLVFDFHAQSMLDQFKGTLDSTFHSHPKAIGIQVAIVANDPSLNWNSAVGFSSVKKKEAFGDYQACLIASNTKTYVAATVLKLVELDQLKLDDPIGSLLSEGTRNLLEETGYKTDLISIRNLLSHSSGIRDYVDIHYLDLVNQDPQYVWSRDEQVELAMQAGGPLAPPNQVFQYGDINYLLATEIIERVYEKPFYTAIRELLGFEELGLKSSWFYPLEAYPAEQGSLAHQYWAEANWDSDTINPSWDLFGGGGLASNASEMAIFYQKLFSAAIIRDTNLLAEMTEPVLPESNYGLGLRRISFYGRTAYYHGGFWGTDVMYLPDYQLSIAVVCLEKDQRDLNAELSEALVLRIEAYLRSSK